MTISSETQICNLALTRVGHAMISSLDDNTKGADLCRLHYPMCRDSVLRAHPWNFAIQRVALASASAAPAFEYDYRFPLPVDCLKVIRTNYEADGCSDVPYRIEGRSLLTNEPSVSIEYIARIEDVTQFDELFADTLASRLAADIAMDLTDNATLAQGMMQTYMARLNEARSVDSQEGTARDVVDTSSWILARL